jgi:hypothetical protein
MPATLGEHTACIECVWYATLAVCGYAACEGCMVLVSQARGPASARSGTSVMQACTHVSLVAGGPHEAAQSLGQKHVKGQGRIDCTPMCATRTSPRCMLQCTVTDCAMGVGGCPHVFSPGPPLLMSPPICMVCYAMLWCGVLAEGCMLWRAVAALIDISCCAPGLLCL